MDGQWVTVGDGVLARRYSELDLTVGSVLGASRALVVDTRGDAEQGAPPDFGDAVVGRWPHTVGALLGLAPTVVVPGHGDPVGPAFVAEQRDRLAEVAALHAAVARGELGPEEATARAPYPGVRWPT